MKNFNILCVNWKIQLLRGGGGGSQKPDIVGRIAKRTGGGGLDSLQI